MPIEIDKEIRPTDLMKNKTERTYLINDIITTERTPPWNLQENISIYKDPETEIKRTWVMKTARAVVIVACGLVKKWMEKYATTLSSSVNIQIQKIVLPNNDHIKKDFT